MVHEMSIYYEARYIPPIQDYDGSFRSLVAVKPLRAGLIVRTNSGYLRSRRIPVATYGLSRCLF